MKQSSYGSNHTGIHVVLNTGLICHHVYNTIMLDHRYVTKCNRNYNK